MIQGLQRLRLPRPILIQLAILAAITAVSGAVMTFGYAKVPALLGVGRYTVIADLSASGGLYPTSVVNFRGSEVGRVKSVNVTRDGVRAVLSLDSSIKVPADVIASVHSRSGIGEQYLDLTPVAGSTDPRNLADGDTITVGPEQIPPDIADLLDATNRALAAIPPDNLRTVIDESAKAVGGLGPELSRIIDGSTSLAIEAGAAIDPLTRLIDDAPPVLDSQVRTADAIAAWAARMASITGQFAAQDAALGELLQAGGPALEEGRALFDRLSPAMPVLLTNLISLGDVAVTYHDSLEQLLVLFPQGTAVMSAITVANAGTKQDYRGIYLDFNLNLNLPPPCNTGFLPVNQQRVPSQVDYPERPAGDLYCRIPQDSDMNVRGVRNIPCANNPAKRAPTVEMCESDEVYISLNDGYNWKGDPNATLSGQGVPQYPPGTDPRLAPPAGTGAALPGATPPGPPPAAPPVAFAPYDPVTGQYTGPDGMTYTQGDLAGQGDKTWESMLVPPGG